TNVISIPKKGIIPQIENIYYDFDKDNITSVAVLILNKIVDIMNDDPTLKIEMASYTDARGLDKYNLALSKRRAKAVFDYLIIKNINGDRMQYNGYGEANLVNHCADKVKCPPEEQQKNRRTEFKILVAP
ncbi:MAG: OmpA family protein, partial [Daejeonella sp.]|uniref:OmpA family protein n=1 Tax=Daejeonella sp. TaxID=2805397 RepID=UPI003C772880